MKTLGQRPRAAHALDRLPVRPRHDQDPGGALGLRMADVSGHVKQAYLGR